MEARQKAHRITEILKAAYGSQKTALFFRDPFGLLVAVILSAQCTDERVNKVTPLLLEKYPTPERMAAAPIEDLEELVRTTGFFRNKARSIKGAAEVIQRRFGGVVPQTMEDLLTLPGVARKTANVVLTSAFGLVEGIVVDTHVKRVAHRLGLTEQTDPVKVERDLMDILPREDWADFSFLLITHGRKVCQARRPRCAACPVLDECRYAREHGFYSR